MRMAPIEYGDFSVSPDNGHGLVSVTGCLKCETWDGDVRVAPVLEPQDGFLKCPQCGCSYGPLASPKAEG